MVDEEIKRIQDREKRNKELDQIKVHKGIVLATKDHEAFKKPSLPFSKVERTLMIYLLIEHISGAKYGTCNLNKLAGIPEEPYGGSKYHFDYFEKVAKVTDDQLALVIRAAIKEKWGNPEVVQSLGVHSTTMYILAEHLGIDINAIQSTQSEVAERRQQKVTARINALKSTKANLAGNKKPSAKKATKNPSEKKSSIEKTNKNVKKGIAAKR
jgi:hypothetical protein